MNHCIKKNDVLRIHLTKQMKDLHTEDYKPLMRETEDINRKLLQTKDCKNLYCHNGWATQSSLQTWYNPYQNLSEVLQDIEKIILKELWREKEL